MPEVRIGSEIKTYPQGTAYAEIAEEYQKNYENDILLVSVNGRLRELHKTLQKDCQMEFITAADTAGYLAYQRSAVFLMMKAFHGCGRQGKCEKYHGSAFLLKMVCMWRWKAG